MKSKEELNSLKIEELLVECMKVKSLDAQRHLSKNKNIQNK